MSTEIPADAPRPRLCHVRKWADFNGFGFNLHAEKGKAGQFIGKIDPGSPAEEAGLKEGDRIIEVNGTNISNENHGQVVQRIKAVPGETKMLVLDSTADDYYKSKKIVVRGDMSNVELRDSGTSRGAGTVTVVQAAPVSTGGYLTPVSLPMSCFVCPERHHITTDDTDRHCTGQTKHDIGRETGV